MQDPSSNAMTEVALGLSMAFFALLILALISIGLKPTAETSNASAPNPTVSATLVESNSSASGEDSEKTLLFYHNGSLYTETLNKVDFTLLDESGSFVIALMPDLNIADALSIQQEISGPNIELTVMNQEWQEYLYRNAAEN